MILKCCQLYLKKAGNKEKNLNISAVITAVILNKGNFK